MAVKQTPILNPADIDVSERLMSESQNTRARSVASLTAQKLTYCAVLRSDQRFTISEYILVILFRRVDLQPAQTVWKV